ncbi:MAG TPA: MBL fold metallo-hydrolase [Candidatus Dormibacteraeota bacterium]|jgi:competence protein ComEC|nr:MBL fold metallo-hydrolase [Candidatus Dormibacteraeota bacterium]
MSISLRSILGVVFLAALCAATSPLAPAQTAKPLLVYCIDVEGGQATLFVTPAGESLLIDTGWDGFGGRDADRIVAAAKDAGLSKIDYVLITHYHSDHVGGVTQLAARIPIGAFIDHGDNSETHDEPTMTGWRAYQKLLAEGKYKRISVKPAEKLPIHDAEFFIVNGGGKVLDKPLADAGGENANCKPTAQPAADHTENEFSLGLVMNFGKLRLVDLGDLPWAKELELMCPVNKLGKADIYIATHHGFNFSGSQALVYGIAARVAIMENGAKKGGSPSAWDIVHSAPGLASLYQLHWSEEGGAAHNSAPEFLANLDGPDGGHYFKITAHQDGSFDILNSRTGKTKSYSPHM